jgi:hypothetical protein
MFLEYVSQILPRVRGLDARDHERVLLAGPLVAELTSSVGDKTMPVGSLTDTAHNQRHVRAHLQYVRRGVWTTLSRRANVIDVSEGHSWEVLVAWLGLRSVA